MTTVSDPDFGWAWYVPASTAFASGLGGGALVLLREVAIMLLLRKIKLNYQSHMTNWVSGDVNC